MKGSAAAPAVPTCIGSGTESGGSKAICSICYEDLKPIAEDLQVISLCGHVFHELCLQQWLEYCPSGKGCTCPVCKQSCTRRSVTHLYFQSTGCVEPSQQPAVQKTLSQAEAESLCREISKLQMKLSTVGSVLDAQKQHVEELNREIVVWKEKAKREEELNNEHRKEKELAHRSLQTKEADLAKTTEECAKHQERSLALAKELAALKLAMDVNLGEEEIAKLASLGHGSRHADAVDVLQRSLFLRNKSYKELMAQCNVLGRAETRSLLKLEKAEERVKKLRKRVQELEKALENKDSDILRDVKFSRGKRERRDDADRPMQDSGSLTCGLPLEANPSHRVETCDSHQINPAEKVVHLSPDPVHRSSTKVLINMSLPKTRVPETGVEASFPSPSPAICQRRSPGDASSGSRESTTKLVSNYLGRIMHGSVPDVISPSTTVETMLVDDDDDVVVVPRNLPEEQGSLNGSIACFGAPLTAANLGALGNAGRYAGKWCKKHQMKVTTAQAPFASGNLISVGADGRGGTVKFLRPHEKSEWKTQSLWPKKCKHGAAAQEGSQTRGCLRIEQFFGKMER